jgi:hypothetical protein
MLKSNILVIGNIQSIIIWALSIFALFYIQNAQICYINADVMMLCVHCYEKSSILSILSHRCAAISTAFKGFPECSLLGQTLTTLLDIMQESRNKWRGIKTRAFGTSCVHEHIRKRVSAQRQHTAGRWSLTLRVCVGGK